MMAIKEGGGKGEPFPHKIVEYVQHTHTHTTHYTPHTTHDTPHTTHTPTNKYTSSKFNRIYYKYLNLNSTIPRFRCHNLHCYYLTYFFMFNHFTFICKQSQGVVLRRQQFVVVEWVHMPTMNI